MNGTARRYFARGNTAHGVHFLYDSAFQGLTALYILQGFPGTGKSRMIRRLANTMMNQGWNVELYHSPLNADTLDAFIVTDLKIGVADGRVCEGLPTADDGVETICIDFRDALDTALLSGTNGEELEDLQRQLSATYSQAYSSFADALRIHDEWEKFYIDNMDFHKADQVAQELANSLFGSRAADTKPTVRHRFLGAATPQGAVDHIPNLTANLEKRIFIKGRAGSGKSTLLKRLAAAAESKGFDVDVFHCGFDPNSLDMLIFPQLSLAIFDSTAPHEYDPSRDGDTILDMYERVIAPGIDEKYETELDAIKLRYKSKMAEATAYLKAAWELDSRMKARYREATDFSRVDQIYEQLQDDVLRRS